MSASTVGTGLTAEVNASDRRGPVPSRERRSGWPLVACAVLATIAACAAFTTSPLGQRPAVRPYTNAVRASVSAAKHRLTDPTSQARDQWPSSRRAP
jgi:hypothetical protein